MSAPTNGDPFAIMKDAAARTEMVISDLLQRNPLPWEYRDGLKVEIAAIRSARALADARAKQAAPDVGGTTLTLTIEEARALRAALSIAALEVDGWQTEDGAEGIAHDGAILSHDSLMALRKRINGGIASNAARRCGQERTEEFRALRAAEAVCDSEDSEEAAS